MMGEFLRSMNFSYYNMKKWAELYPDNFYILKYDSVILDTKNELLQLCDWLDIGFDDNLLMRNYYSNKFMSFRLNYLLIVPFLLSGLGFIGAEAYLDLSIVIKVILLALFAAISYGAFNAVLKGRYLLIKPVSSV